MSRAGEKRGEEGLFPLAFTLVDCCVFEEYTWAKTFWNEIHTLFQMLPKCQFKLHSRTTKPEIQQIKPFKVWGSFQMEEWICESPRYNFSDLLTYLPFSTFFATLAIYYFGEGIRSFRAKKSPFGSCLMRKSTLVLNNSAALSAPCQVFWILMKLLCIRFTKLLYWWEKGGRDCGRLRRFGDSDQESIRFGSAMGCVWPKL